MHRVAWAFAFLLTSTTTFAHGPAPTALEIHLDDEGDIRLVYTNIGLATPTLAGQYRYICPIMWGEEDYFPKPIIDADGLIAVPTAGVVHRGDGCVLNPVILEGWTGQLSGQGGAFILERHERGSRLWSIAAQSRVLWSIDEVAIDSFVASQGQTILASSRGPLALYRVNELGMSEVIELMDPPSGDYASLRLASPIWFTLSDGSDTTLYEVVGDGAQSRAENALVIHGPVHWRDGVAWLQDGRLIVQADGAVAELAVVDWKCLKRAGDMIYACSDRDLIEVVPTELGYETKPLFELADFSGVDPQCPSSQTELYSTCVRQWYHFGGEAGLITEALPRSDGRETSCQTTPGFSIWVGWCIALALLLRRNRLRLSC